LFLAFSADESLDGAEVESSVELLRVGPVQKGRRTVHFKVTLTLGVAAGSVSEEQTAEVQDSGGVFVFEGPMADASKPLTEVLGRIIYLVHESVFLDTPCLYYAVG
jgi:hypothetical protein